MSILSHPPLRPAAYYRFDADNTGYDLLRRLYVLNLVRPVTLSRHFRAFFCRHEKDTLVGGFLHSPRIAKTKSGKPGVDFGEEERTRVI